jgi:hypothetical protein
MIAPDAFTRSTTMESMSGTRSRNQADPMVVVTPLVNSRSLMEMGTPCSGPRSEPLCTAASAARASARAWSWQRVRYEFNWESSWSIRWKKFSVASSDDIFFSRMFRASSTADMKAKSALISVLSML